VRNIAQEFGPDEAVDEGQSDDDDDDDEIASQFSKLSDDDRDDREVHANIEAALVTLAREAAPAKKKKG
jgi:hypothetical protein